MITLKSPANRAYHRMLDTVLRVDRSSTLNGGLPVVQREGDLAGDLLSSLRVIQAEAVDPITGAVDYAGLRHSPSYARYRTHSAGLIAFDPATLTSREARLAFWINLYNALTIDAVIAFDARRSVRDDLGFFRRAAYTVGGFRYSADDIEHGILRGNRRHFHLAIWFSQFAPDDPRLLHTIIPPDPRVHFTLFCATQSCPPFSTYHSADLDAQMETATRQFINTTTATLSGRPAVSVSPIFKWYRRDFEEAGGVVQFLLRYLDSGPARDILEAPEGRLRYHRFDWTLNQTPGGVRETAAS